MQCVSFYGIVPFWHDRVALKRADCSGKLLVHEILLIAHEAVHMRPVGGLQLQHKLTLQASCTGAVSNLGRFDAPFHF